MNNKEKLVQSYVKSAQSQAGGGGVRLTAPIEPLWQSIHHAIVNFLVVSKKKFRPKFGMMFSGFTLAEVLITLGIIGVIAALTMPSLISNYKEKQLSNQFKTSYSLLSQGYSKMLADDAVTDFEETSIYSRLVADNYRTSVLEAKIFEKYFNTVVYVPYEQQVAEGWPAGNNDVTGEACTKFVGKGSTWWLRNKKKCRGLRQQVYRLSNGALVRAMFSGSYPRFDNGGNLKRPFAELTVDVNGKKQPNTFGEDVFMFLVGQDGKLYPYYGMDFAQYYAAKQSSNYEKYYYLQGGKDACRDGNGTACAGPVIEHNFDIHYYK